MDNQILLYLKLKIIMLTDQEITVVIPTYFNLMDFKLTFNGVLSQSKTPKEIIIIDSSEDLLIQQFLEEETHTKSIEIIYLRQVKKLFPGAARNLGVSIASSRWIAFLDTKTIPDSNWLKSSLKKAISSKADVVFGKTKYKASTSFQFYLIGSTYGYYPIVTVPGTLISKNKFQETNGFNSIVRSGEDIEWKKEVSEKFYTTEIDDRESLSYSSLPRTLYKTLKSENNTNGQVINIGYGKPYNLKKLINLIRSKLKFGNPDFDKIKLRKEENLVTYPSIYKAKKILKWIPNTKLENGITKTIKSYKKLKL